MPASPRNQHFARTLIHSTTMTTHDIGTIDDDTPMLSCQIIANKFNARPLDNFDRSKRLSTIVSSSLRSGASGSLQAHVKRLDHLFHTTPQRVSYSKATQVGLKAHRCP